MKRIAAIFLVIFMSFSSYFQITAYAADNVIPLTAESAILIDAATGDVLYEKNSNKQMYPASTTKIMTAILTLENSNLNDKVIIDKDTPFTDGSSIYVREGEEFTVEQLLYALMVESANDAAVALAKHVSGNVSAFVDKMNKRAAELGATNTHFNNPNGLPDTKHLTTAHDLAVIARYGMTIPKFTELVRTARYQIPPTNKVNETRYLRNTDRFLWGTGSQNKINYKGKYIDIKYDIVDGVKTGYTTVAGNCIVSTASKNGRRLIAVVLKTHGSDLYLDARILLDYGFDNFENVELVKSGEEIQKANIENGVSNEVGLVAQDDLSRTLPLSAKDVKITKNFVVNENIYAPIQKGAVLGKATYTLNGTVLGEVNLVAKEQVDEKAIVKVEKKLLSPKALVFYKITAAIFVLVVFLGIYIVLGKRKNRYRW
ncbi:MAG: D-alanyl-D-alanine carboxypeptidase family protein [Caulobacteraceae bacterium]